MDKLLGQLRRDYRHAGLEFVAGKVFCWSPADRQVRYKAGADGPAAICSLLHELGHAVLDHKRYGQDFELLELEVDAWEAAKRIAAKYSITIDEDHAQDCLDSYRDWLYRRSICPTCATKSLQTDGQPSYRCFNCGTGWRVAASRFCRPYRQTGRGGQAATASVATFALERP
jgi:hypothetical protein